MNMRFLPVVAVCLVLTAGCEKSTSASAKDVAKARENATENSNEARNDADKVAAETNANLATVAQANAKADANARADMSAAESKAQAATAQANFNVAMTDAKGAYDIAKEKCSTLKSVDKDACLSTIAATLAADEAAATATRDRSLAAADHQI
jgi:hypothetical protein